MSNLHQRIEALARAFAAELVAGLRGSTLEHISGEARSLTGSRGRSYRPGRPAPGKRERRSEADIAAAADRIVALVARNAGGLRSEQIREELGIAKNHWARPLELALTSGRLTKTGEKRATTYFAA